MEFCPECNSMLYTKLEEIESDDLVSTQRLTNYCKNCGYKDVIPENKDKSVYLRNYENDYVVDKLLTNKYTIFDNALPRLSMKCINENCITNHKINTDSSFIIDNIPENYNIENFKILLSNYSEIILDFIQVRLTSIVIKLNDSESESLIQKNKENITNDINNTIIIYSKDILETEIKTLSQKYNKLIKKIVPGTNNSYLITLHNFKDESFFNELNTLKIYYEKFSLKINEFKIPESEVLYIKYDPDNMKYLYMCVNCSTSWKGN